MSKQARVRPSWKKPNHRKLRRRSWHNDKKSQATAERRLVGKLADEICKEEDKRIVEELKKAPWEAKA